MSLNITFRNGLGRPLTHTELDNNFRFLHDWQPNTPYSAGMYVEYEEGGISNLYKAKFDIPAIAFFNSNDWTRIGDTSSGIDSEIVADQFVYATGSVESPFVLSEVVQQLIAVEVNGNDIIDTDDYTFDSNNNQVFYVGANYALGDGDNIVIKYTTSSQVGGGATNENLKDIRVTTPNEGATENVLASDEYLSILSNNITTALTVQLPATPAVGHEVKIIDSSGNVGTNGYTYTIAADVADNIEGNPSVTLTQDWETVTLVFLGNNLWKLV